MTETHDTDELGPRTRRGRSTADDAGVVTDDATTRDDLSGDVAGAPRLPLVFALLLIITGALGLLASFELTLDYFIKLKDPLAELSCSVNVTVDCGVNLNSWQGKLFGFPNPVLGLMMFPAPIVVGMAMLAGARFRAWFWWIFTAGVWFGMGFSAWLAYQSFFNLGTLCPWCALVYVIIVPMWLSVTVRVMSEGFAGRALARVGQALTWWIPLMTLIGYVIIFGAAQWRLGVIQSFLI